MTLNAPPQDPPRIAADVAPPPQSGLSLRGASEADWPAIGRLLLVNGLPMDGAYDHLGEFVLAEQGGQIAGCAGLERHGDVALLRSVVVAAPVRRQRLGTRLVEALEARAAACGLLSLHLLTTTAAPWFARRGYVEQPLEQAPDALRASAELRGACPSSATFMTLTLGAAPHGPG